MQLRRFQCSAVVGFCRLNAIHILGPFLQRGDPHRIKNQDIYGLFKNEIVFTLLCLLVSSKHVIQIKTF